MSEDASGASSAASSPRSSTATSDEAAARLAALKQRLNAVSSKHISSGGLSVGSSAGSSSPGPGDGPAPPAASGKRPISGPDTYGSLGSFGSPGVESERSSVAPSDDGAMTTLATMATRQPSAPPRLGGGAAPAAASSFATRIFSGIGGGGGGGGSSGLSRSASARSSVADIVPSSQTPLPEPDPTCPCNSILSFSDPRKCTKCGGGVKAVIRLVDQKIQAEQHCEQLKKKLDVAAARQDESTIEMAKLRQKAEKLEEVLDHKQYELTQVKRDLETLGEKLIDEIEKRAELQHSKETVQDELEELTKSLFEEANTMVANEARQRHEYQEREQTLAEELRQTKLRLQLEEAQLRELRIRMGQLQDDNERLQVAVGQQQHQRTASGTGRPLLHQIQQQQHPEGATHLRVNTGDSNGDDAAEADEEDDALALLPEQLIDPQLFAQFEEFLQHATTAKVNKLHALTFMRNALEDDVTPCLRFGGNPRTSTKKFIDAIMAHVCFVEEMSADQIQQLITRDEKAAQLAAERESAAAAAAAAAAERSPDSASGKASGKSSSSQGLFNKTVLERLTSALSNANLASLGSSDSSSHSHAGCSTCGKNEPYKYHFKISDVSDETWYPICVNCRDRLVSVVDFYAFIRHVRQGLYTTRRPQDLYMEVLSLKRAMFYTRIGASQVGNKDRAFKKIRPVRPNSVFGMGMVPQSALVGGLVPTPSSASSSVLRDGSPNVASTNSDIMPLAILQERLNRATAAASAAAAIPMSPSIASDGSMTPVSAAAMPHLTHLSIESPAPPAENAEPAAK
ncbi:RAB3A interacting protein [Polyrhizophydium stewartii]|uniref:RAB3A interacting protein n=1 Tax=Polyrhizophydium stewartii TaxID=2732419 RepID=A0ABR4NK58_9FUNG|nr:hypothetical protein HK105_002971 [Polyrhizophydium stewartii]